MGLRPLPGEYSNYEWFDTTELKSLTDEDIEQQEAAKASQQPSVASTAVRTSNSTQRHTQSAKNAHNGTQRRKRR
jgi:hypothetical protein